MSAPKVDVLAVLDAEITDLSQTSDAEEVREYGFRQREAVLREARAAVAELIEAVRAAEALAVCCMAIDCYSRDELYDSAEANRVIFAKALARIGGAA